MERIFGAVKIIDGLFTGDEFAAQDLEFIVTNKVKGVINCASAHVPNHWEPIGVEYLPLQWLDHEQSQQLFGPQYSVFDTIYGFIEQFIEESDVVLVNSVNGQCRPTVVAAAYLMRRYHWSLQKALQFVQQRRPDIVLRQSFLQQLIGLETRLRKSGGVGTSTSDWNTICSDPLIQQEDLVLRNTYLNASVVAEALHTAQQPSENEKSDKERILVQWMDGESGDVGELVDVQHGQSMNPVEYGHVILRPAVKGGRHCDRVFKIPLRDPTSHPERFISTAPTEWHKKPPTRVASTSSTRKTAPMPVSKVGTRAQAVSKKHATTDDLFTQADNMLEKIRRSNSGTSSSRRKLKGNGKKVRLPPYRVN